MKRTPISLLLPGCLLVANNALAAMPNWDEVENILIYNQSPLSEHDGDVVKRLSAEELKKSQAISLARVLDANLNSVTINDVQNNPFQTDVQYRGFTASPLLGMPQGLSVYLNGTRFNEPFGDTVNWDLIPVTAIESVSLASGANPVFGQNTLGGALLVESKTGFTFDQNQILLQGGRYGQQGLNVQSGGNSGDWGYYVNVNTFGEDGWRRFSPTSLRQAMANLSHQTADSETLITTLFTDNDMIGNGAIPVELIPEEGRRAIFTRPDQTFTQLSFLSAQHKISLSDTTTLAINGYYRENEIETYNGDDSDYEECDVGYGETLCEEEEGEDDEEEEEVDEEFEEDDAVEFVGYAPLTPLDAFSDVDPDSLDGTANTSFTDNKSYGIAFELSGTHASGNFRHLWTLGAGWDEASIDFRSDTEFALLENGTIDSTRGVTGTGIYDMGSRVRLQTDVRHLHAFISDMIQLNDNWTLRLSGRFNRSDIDMVDGIETGEGSLNGNHGFTRFNPAATLIYEQNGWRMTVGYSQSSRTPSPAELSCADEDDPCKLPNGFVADPPLDQVVTDTLEVTYAREFEKGQLSAAIFRSVSRDDIIFQQAGGRPSVGYFVNIDETQRQGAEFEATTQLGALSAQFQVSYLDATFESPFVSFSPQNPLGGDRQVMPGDRIPGQPEWQTGLNLDYAVTDALSAFADIHYTSGQYFRGDEANENRELSGYTLVDIGVRYHVNDNLEVGARVDNLFDKDYETFGTYGEADEVLENLYPDIESPEFIGVGAPRMWRVYASYSF